MSFEQWVRTVPTAITNDSLWRMEAYRLALFAADGGWPDIVALSERRHTQSMADQLCRALGSVSANLAEGYGRLPGRDRARFYMYSFSSARECLDHYHRARHVVGDDRAATQSATLVSVPRLLAVEIRYQRTRAPKSGP